MLSSLLVHVDQIDKPCLSEGIDAMRCGCIKNIEYFASMWTNGGFPAHIHYDGSTASGGPDAATDNRARQFAERFLAAGWIKRGWL